MSAAAPEVASNLQAALQVAEEYGLPVFPCRSKAEAINGKIQQPKSPLTPHGFKDASREREQIIHWWTRWPDALVGVPTGAAPGLLVVDIDPDGAPWYSEHEEQLGPGRTHQTQRGQHLLYRYSPGLPIRNSAGKVAAGVDVRGEGGYVIWWPAHGFGAVGKLSDLADPPDWLGNVLLKAGKREGRQDDSKNGAQSAGKIGEGERNGYLSAIAFRLRRAGLSVGEILTALRPINTDQCDPPLPDAELRAIAEGKAHVKPDGRTVIELTAGRLHESANRAVELLQPDAFVRGGELVYVGQVREANASSADGTCIDRTTGVVRAATSTVCLPLRPGRVRLMLSERVRFMQYNGRVNRLLDKNCPRELAELIAGSADWPQLRPLTSIVDAPTLRPDMSVIDQPGYDPATGIWYAPSCQFPDVPATPKREDAVAALEVLLEPIAQFPFQTPEAAAVALAHILTAAVRPVLPTVPVFVYAASLAGSGKTLLNKMPSLIAHSRTPAERPWPGTKEEEIRKVLGAVVRSADPELRFDNVPNGAPIDSPTLCAFATAAQWSDRLLGVSESFTVPNRCTVSLTGNNIMPRGDLARRSLICRLEVQAETTRGRSFRIKDLPAYVRMHRSELLVAALTIVRAYAVAGRPITVEPLASFEDWSRVVREALIWLDAGDPVATQALDADDGLDALREAFAEIDKATGGAAFAAAHLAATAANTADLQDRALGEQTPLFTALQEAGCLKPAESRPVGAWLRTHHGRIAGGLKLCYWEGKIGRWQLKKAADSAPNGGDDGDGGHVYP